MGRDQEVDMTPMSAQETGGLGGPAFLKLKATGIQRTTRGWLILVCGLAHQTSSLCYT